LPGNTARRFLTVQWRRVHARRMFCPSPEIGNAVPTLPNPEVLRVRLPYPRESVVPMAGLPGTECTIHRIPGQRTVPDYAETLQDRFGRPGQSSFPCPTGSRHFAPTRNP